MNKIFTILIFILLIVLGATSYFLKQETNLQDNAQVSFFYSESCTVCARVKVLLEDFDDRYPSVIVEELSISNKKVVEKLIFLYEKHSVAEDRYGMVPIIFFDDEYFIGFSDNVAQRLEEKFAFLAGIEVQEGTALKEENINLPILGEIRKDQYSLPITAVLMGFFDGFNVCSLGALVLILGLVLILKSRKKILIFGGIFIFTTSLVYGLLIFLWFQLFLFLAPYLKIMEILVGLLGVAGGFYFFKDFLKFAKQGPTCEMQKGGVVSKFSNKIQNTLQSSESIFAVILAILFFAVVITIAEFPCSAAVPLFFAGILAEANLSVFHYLLYISIFILFYMIDEIIVFLIAVFTMTIKLSSKSFTTWITFVESLVLFLLGLYYLFGFLIF